MKIIKKIIKCLLILSIISILFTPILIKFIPIKYFSLLVGKLAVVDNYVCTISTKYSGESMNPLIISGTKIELNRCFNETDLVENIFVYYNDGSNLRPGIIRHILPLDPIIYKISDEKAPQLFHDVIKDEIIGISKNIDTSKSNYQTKQDTKSFILNINDFLTDLYLAKIPSGMGIEVSTIEKTNTFSQKYDKFCSAIIPKKKIYGVDIEIINTQTSEVVYSGYDRVFDITPSPNINCHEFGSSLGMINLNPGFYQYRFFINHQILKEIKFEVR